MPAKCRLDGLTVGPVNAPYGPSVNAAVQPVSPPFKQQTPVHPLPVGVVYVTHGLGGTAVCGPLLL